jgi:hypothetical protein
MLSPHSEGEMDDLAARLQALFRSYAVAIDLQPETIDRLCKRFREELRLLVVEYGHAAVDKAIDELPDRPWPSAFLH